MTPTEIEAEVEALKTRSLTPGSQIATHSGLLVDPFNMSPDDIVLEDIIWGLSHIYRYGGHADPGITVAEHSLMVAGILKESGGIWTPYALLHDACETYLGDVPSPMKSSLKIHRDGASWSFEEAERRVTFAVAYHFGLDPMVFQNPALHRADLLARDIERSTMQNMKWNEPVVPEKYRALRPMHYSPGDVQEILRAAFKEAGVSDA
jgi:hypothetical protein